MTKPGTRTTGSGFRRPSVLSATLAMLSVGVRSLWFMSLIPHASAFDIVMGRSMSIDNITLAKCQDNLLISDEDSDGELSPDEFAPFLALQSEGIINVSDFNSIPLRLIMIYHYTACLCTAVQDAGCCVGDAAHVQIEDDGTFDHESYIRFFCSEIEQGIDDIRSLYPYGPPQPVRLKLPVPEIPTAEMIGAKMLRIDISPDGELQYQKVADEGFGSLMNKYVWSNAINDDGDICVGTWNAELDVARLDSFVTQVQASGNPVAAFDAFGRTWTTSPITPRTEEGGQVYCKKHDEDDFQFVFELPPEHRGLRNMVFYDGRFYGVSTNGPEGPDDPDPTIAYNPSQVYDRSAEGAALWRGDSNTGSWEQVIPPSGILSGFDRSMRAMCISSTTGRLFMGTETFFSLASFARVITYNADDDSWGSIQAKSLVGVVTKCMELQPGLMLVGASGPLGPLLFTVDETNGDEVEDVSSNLRTLLRDSLADNPGPRLLISINVILELRVFDGKLFVGILDYAGFDMYKTDNLDFDSWTFDVVTKDGFESEQIEALAPLGGPVSVPIGRNAYPWSSAVVNGVYYLGTWSDVNPSEESTNDLAFADGRAQLWSSTDGSTWEMVVADAFGEPWTYGFRTILSCPDETCMYIGTAADFFAPATAAGSELQETFLLAAYSGLFP